MGHLDPTQESQAASEEKLKAYACELEQKLVARTRELAEARGHLSEALEQQSATSEVLQVISSSPGELEPVFQSMLANAIRLCQAKFGNLYLCEGDAFRTVALHGATPEYTEARRRAPLIRPAANTGLRRVLETNQAVQIADVQAVAGYLDNPVQAPFAQLAGARSLLSVPMLKDDELVGAIEIYRQEVCPFTDKQIELVRNFATQAVIAIENARLLGELRESLQQQTATADVLGVISSSPGDLEPVFRAMLQNSIRICEAKFGQMFLSDQNTVRMVAHLGVPAALAEFDERRGAFQPMAGGLLERVLRTKQFVHVVDMSSEYAEHPVVRLGGGRSYIAVPMLKENELIGAITIYRQEVRLFTDKQIALVQNFASQAVIAIENTRLLNELRESLQQQTATADVLKVISRSAFDLQSVLDTLVQSAVRLCEARFGAVFRLDHDLLHLAAQYNVDEELGWVALIKGRYPMAPNRGHISGRAILTGGPVQIPDILADHEYQGRGTKDAGFRSLLGVPLLREGDAIGAIVIYRKEPGAFTDKQLALLQNFADQAIIAIENARLLNELRQRTTDLTEALEYQTGTSDVLKVISQSGAELGPLLDTLVATAARICLADSGFIFRLHDGLCRMVASFGIPAEYKDFQARNPIAPGRGTLAGRTVLERRAVQIEDAAADPEYTRIEAVQLGNQRTMLGVPLVRDDALIGVITLARSRVEAFSEKEVARVATFADQAVIAIENARLLSELRERTTDLSKALDQQTATSEVLQGISSSPGELEPVFQAILAHATRLCEASYGAMWLKEGDLFRNAAFHGVLPAAYIEQWRSARVSHTAPTGRVAQSRKPLQIADLREDQTYLDRYPLTVTAVDVAGIRTLAIVPMLKEDEFVGGISIYRKEVHPFTDKQIELVQNFANQAVIAIENTRLLNELRQSLQQQTATADVLKVISRSTFDLKTVLQTLVESAARLCEADQATITREIGGKFFRAEAYGFSSE